MSEPGHIYVLVNPSIEGLVKIGKTTRDPESRARELSQATGVATPFYAAFSIEVDDCHAAESYVYAVLEHNGFKRSPNREFFEMPLRSAVELLTLVAKELREQADSVYQVEQQTPSESKHPGGAILHKAWNVFHGNGDEIKDEIEALRLLHQAKALNFAPAFTALAEYFTLEDGAFDVEAEDGGWMKSREKAFDVLKEGARKGHGRCYIKMGGFYDLSDLSACPGADPEPENANKCWKKYFQSPTFINDDDRKWGWGLDWIDELEGGRSRVEYARQYLDHAHMGCFTLDPEIRQILLPLRDHIIEMYVGMVQWAQEQEDLHPGKGTIGFWNDRLKFVESSL